jgi:hypothetical protein
MSVTHLIWIAGVVVFFMVGMSISNSISALAHRLDVLAHRLDSALEIKFDNHIGGLKVELELDRPLKIRLDSPLKVELDNHILPLKVALDNDGPLRIELDHPANLGKGS